MKSFGEVIAELRREQGLTQTALAAQIKKKDGTALGLAYINDIEHDRRGPPAPEFVRQLAEVLRVPLEVLQFYAGRLPPETPERRDPSHQQIVAAYRAFRRELQKRRGG
jgi:transcriptional regulator with XRE-family HTH domain